MYLMFGLYTKSMKYFTALNEPQEEAYRKRGIISLHQSFFILRCQRGVVHSLPPSTHSLSIFNTLEIQVNMNSEGWWKVDMWVSEWLVQM